jgi:hypothetical protein
MVYENEVEVEVEVEVEIEVEARTVRIGLVQHISTSTQFRGEVEKWNSGDGV